MKVFAVVINMLFIIGLVTSILCLFGIGDYKHSFICSLLVIYAIVNLIGLFTEGF